MMVQMMVGLVGQLRVASGRLLTACVCITRDCVYVWWVVMYVGGLLCTFEGCYVGLLVVMYFGGSLCTLVGC